MVIAIEFYYTRNFYPFINPIRSNKYPVDVLHYNLNPNVSNSVHAADSTGDSRRIFFHETSGNGRLSFRQCCAIESAAKNNPTRPVTLYISADNLSDTKPWLDVLRQYENIAVELVDNAKWFQGSPFQVWYDKGEWRNSRFRTVHLSDYIRLISLYEKGGFYLDLDYVILRPLDETYLHNFLLVEGISAEQLNNGVLHLEAKHRLIGELIKELTDNYDPEDYFLHGPTALTNIYRRLCVDTTSTSVPMENVSLNSNSTSPCPDVKLISYKYFCPIGPPFWHLYFEDASAQSLAMLNKSYGVHIWNSLSVNETIRMGTKQMYALLVAKHCPVASSYYNQFLAH